MSSLWVPMDRMGFKTVVDCWHTSPHSGVYFLSTRHSRCLSAYVFIQDEKLKAVVLRVSPGAGCRGWRTGAWETSVDHSPVVRHSVRLCYYWGTCHRLHTHTRPPERKVFLSTGPHLEVRGGFHNSMLYYGKCCGKCQYFHALSLSEQIEVDLFNQQRLFRLTISCP